MLGELSLGDQHLAASAEPTPAAHRVHIDAEASRRLQQRACPRGKWPRLPEGMNTTRGSRVAMQERRTCAGVRPAGGDGRLRGVRARRLAGGRPGRGGGRRLAEAPDPARAIGIVAQHDVGAHDGLDDLDVHGVGDRRGHPGAIAMVRNAALMPSRFGSPKLMFEAPQEVFTLSSVAQAVDQPHHLHPGLLIAPIGITSGSTTTSLAGMP